MTTPDAPRISELEQAQLNVQHFTKSFDENHGINTDVINARIREAAQERRRAQAENAHALLGGTAIGALQVRPDIII